MALNIEMLRLNNWVKKEYQVLPLISKKQKSGTTFVIPLFLFYGFAILVLKTIFKVGIGIPRLDFNPFFMI